MTLLRVKKITNWRLQSVDDDWRPQKIDGAINPKYIAQINNASTPEYSAVYITLSNGDWLYCQGDFEQFLDYVTPKSNA